ncbi:hypothetical protein MHYP_G00183180 [Metynnis hypsauchen]
MLKESALLNPTPAVAPGASLTSKFPPSEHLHVSCYLAVALAPPSVYVSPQKDPQAQVSSKYPGSSPHRGPGLGLRRTLVLAPLVPPSVSSVKSLETQITPPPPPPPLPFPFRVGTGCADVTARVHFRSESRSQVNVPNPTPKELRALRISEMEVDCVDHDVMRGFGQKVQSV